MKHIFWFWLPPIGYLAAIFFVSSLPNPQIGGETPDYILHALEYFLLALLLMRLLLARPSPVRPEPVEGRTQQSLKGARGNFTTWQQLCLLGVIITILYGVTDEIHQYFVPNRQCSLHDVLADTLGALLAYGIASLDYLLLNRYPSWTIFLKRFKLTRSVSYAAYRFNPPET